MSQPGLRARLITLVTTRIDVAGYGKDALADLYDKRWEVATHLRQLQTPMQMAVLHCKTVLGVLKELTVFTLLYHLVRRVIRPSAEHQQVDIERISFLDALRWFRAPASGVPWEELFGNLWRPNRVEPRVQKRRPKKYPFMTKPRQVFRNQLRQQAVGA